MPRKRDFDNAHNDNSASFMGINRFLVVIFMFLACLGDIFLQEIYN
jgi:hypothetical protein